MSIFLGSSGRLVELPYASAQSVESAEQYNFKQTVEGKNVAQWLPQTYRTWSLEGKHYRPNEVALLMGFTNGAWGKGPFVFVSADAPVTNMLTPRASTCDPAELALGSGATLLGTPPLLTPDGWAPRSVWKSNGGSVAIGAAVSVLPGDPVTASAYVAGADGYVRLQFLNSAGSEISIHNSAPAVSVVSRRSVTQVAPATAIAARIWVSSAVMQAANPTITWTDSVREFSDGQGCPQAVVHAVSRDVVKAMPNAHGGRYSNVGFSVTEVG